MTFSQRIRALEKRGYTLAEIGRRVGLARNTVCDLKHGRTAAPRGSAALKLHDLHQSEQRRTARARRRA